MSCTCYLGVDGVQGDIINSFHPKWRGSPTRSLAGKFQGGVWERLYWRQVQFSRSVMSDCLRPYGLQHTRPPCPSPTPRVYSNSCPLSWWCHSTISSSVVPFSSCLKSFPGSGSFQMSHFFVSGSQIFIITIYFTIRFPYIETNSWRDYKNLKKTTANYLSLFSFLLKYRTFHFIMKFNF